MANFLHGFDRYFRLLLLLLELLLIWLLMLLVLVLVLVQRSAGLLHESRPFERGHKPLWKGHGCVVTASNNVIVRSL